MAKLKKGGGQSHTHLHARINYLRKAAIYLHSPYMSVADERIGVQAKGAPTTRVAQEIKSPRTSQNITGDVPHNAALKRNISQIYASHMRGVSLKTQLRLPVAVKRSFCKRCNMYLIPGVSCVEEIRNDSRGGKKPWADVWIVRCISCGTEKRFPRTERRSKKLLDRKREKEYEKKEHSSDL